MKQLLLYEDWFSYCIIGIADSSTNPYSYWTHEHDKQGFAWRPGSIVYGVEDTNGYTIELCLNDKIAVESHVKRAIVLPFTVLADGIVRICTVEDVRTIEVGAGEYALLFEYWEIDDKGWLRFSFIPQTNVQPAILKADETLSPSTPLFMGADPIEG